MTAPADVRPHNVATREDALDLYRVFLYLFGFPSRDRFDRICRRDFPEALKNLWRELHGPGEFPRLRTFEQYAQYESAYIALFDVGVPAPPVPLLESAWRKSQPAQQVVLDNVNFYEVLGLRCDQSHYPPDHLLTQLEFLAAVRYAQESVGAAGNRNDLVTLERDFLARHLLVWFPAAAEKLRALDPPVFPSLATLLEAFLRFRLQMARFRSRTR
ncbi:MAG: molecular chaperone TorD family protein [Firmicutes bacterium]|nr:molecular chaperone TorD family protein [Bacillota bacterium]